jgi:hypothetical protein
MLTVFKVVGALALILPFINKRIKEWAYAGFSFTAISAFVSHTAVDGFGVQAAFPLFVLAILAVSYLSYHRIAKYRQLRNSGESEYNVDGVLS